ncbi:MAG: hypothetical protein V9E83_13325 [Baekduia sp.]
MQVSRLVPTVAIMFSLVVGLSACGEHGEPNIGKTEGDYVTTGGLQYQVQISRQLNPYDTEDRDYLIGMPKGSELRRGEQYFGIFMRAFNRSDTAARAASGYYLTDTTGKRFDPIPLDTNINRVAFKPAVLKPNDQLPLPGSLARENTTQGGLVLFRLPVTAYDSRPLTLHIEPPDGGEGAIVAIDV